MKHFPRSPATICAVLLLPCALAAETPQEQRHELMEEMGDNAKIVGQMLEGETPFDAAAAMTAMQNWQGGSEGFGDLFPEGSESGHDTEAKSTIWTDREGFNAALAAWSEAVEAAIAANPQDLESLQAAVGPVFKKCKACHEEYRVDD
jgi:cytochrome c556